MCFVSNSGLLVNEGVNSSCREGVNLRCRLTPILLHECLEDGILYFSLAGDQPPKAVEYAVN